MQERRNSIANALELRLSCINPIDIIFKFDNWFHNTADAINWCHQISDWLKKVYLNIVSLRFDTKCNKNELKWIEKQILNPWQGISV